MPDVITLGEVVVDIFANPISTPLKQATDFTIALGGSQANVAVTLTRLGATAGFIGKAGADPFGERFLELLGAEGVDTAHFKLVRGSPTPVAWVDASDPRNVDFIFYRGASGELTTQDIDPAYLASARLFLYNSVTLTGGSKAAVLHAARLAKEGGALVSYDVNYRQPLWPDRSVARATILEGMRGADILKANEVDIELLAGTGDLPAASRWLLEQGVQLCLVTLGAGGTYFNNGRAEGHVPAFQVDAIDTTGCGDAFVGGLVSGLLGTSLNLPALDEPTLRRLVRYANAVGALTATGMGAMAPLPTRAEVEAFLEAHPEG
jgi:sugar/nucleoside kinase (ribokinase family)